MLRSIHDTWPFLRHCLRRNCIIYALTAGAEHDHEKPITHRGCGLQNERQVGGEDKKTWGFIESGNRRMHGAWCSMILRGTSLASSPTLSPHSDRRLKYSVGYFCYESGCLETFFFCFVLR